jgi:hypothetical protein
MSSTEVPLCDDGATASYDDDEPVVAAAGTAAATAFALVEHPACVFSPEQHKSIAVNLRNLDNPYWPSIPEESQDHLPKVLWPIVLAYAAPRPRFKKHQAPESDDRTFLWQWEDMPHQFGVECGPYHCYSWIKSRIPGSRYAWRYSNASLDILDSFDRAIVGVVFDSYSDKAQLKHIGGGRAEVTHASAGLVGKLPVMDRSCIIKGDVRVLTPILKMLIDMIKRHRRVDRFLARKW